MEFLLFLVSYWGFKVKELLISVNLLWKSASWSEDFLPEYLLVVLIHLCRHHILHCLGSTAKVPWKVTGVCLWGSIRLTH